MALELKGRLTREHRKSIHALALDLQVAHKLILQEGAQALVLAQGYE